MITTKDMNMIREFGWEVGHDYIQNKFIGVNAITEEQTPYFNHAVDVYEWIKQKNKDKL